MNFRRHFIFVWDVESPSTSLPFSSFLFLYLSICQRYSQVNPLCGYAPSWNSESLAQVSRVSPISLCIAVLQLVWFPWFPYGSRDRTPSVSCCEASLAFATRCRQSAREREDDTTPTDRRRRAERREMEKRTEVTRKGVENVKICAQVHLKKRRSTVTAGRMMR